MVSSSFILSSRDGSSVFINIILLTALILKTPKQKELIFYLVFVLFYVC